ncbi:hypothetical protein FHW96_002177 [Novosphingobium sp. SG751A]|uniref:anti-sigma factor n=1 Tax=Novosphingobium sp. SG751A TaxID=2587000 RepID=UPI0015555DB6|nr:anti-sigma factor [Novosphingobium sp. SG751A]NOW46019.1 hypothetical protein [Novosphingobium sp. SG751A]
MSVSREEIMAYVDGEIDEAARERITLAALSDLDLAEAIARERALRERLQGHFAGVTQEPVPPAWEAMIREQTTPAPVIDLAQVRRRKAEEAKVAQPKIPLSQRKWFGGAIAAALVMGLFLGGQMMGREGPITAKDGALLASGDLAHALDRQLAADDGATRMIATFRRGDGALCRAFSGASASGVACHGGDGWRLEHVMPGSGASGAQYRQAGSADGAVMAIAQDMAVGEPLDAAQEKAAKDKGWR